MSIQRKLCTSHCVFQLEGIWRAGIPQTPLVEAQSIFISTSNVIQALFFALPSWSLISQTRMAWEVKLHMKTNMWKDINKINSQQMWSKDLRVQGTLGGITDAQGANKIHFFQRTLIMTECFLYTKHFARYFTWFITQILRTTEEVSTIIPILEMRKFGLVLGRITCPSSYNKKVKTGFEFGNFDSRSWDHNYYLISLQKKNAYFCWGTKASRNIRK